MLRNFRESFVHSVNSIERFHFGSEFELICKGICSHPHSLDSSHFNSEFPRHVTAARRIRQAVATRQCCVAVRSTKSAALRAVYAVRRSTAVCCGELHCVVDSEWCHSPRTAPRGPSPRTAPRVLRTAGTADCGPAAQHCYTEARALVSVVPQ